ncbi:hypothetical protein N7478_009207 [Penicillium angulare]|uniref:uncharacterized protein n=1 Tax=Penicillium angulare TaxID=116970 RepID=UPI002541361A|nr:uncharacterized protein N7478_009207 [Penicillium angulare]KAJ5274082.1 hypothetical protein N7478_009207 [Penicillium angulare]
MAQSWLGLLALLSPVAFAAQNYKPIAYNVGSGPDIDGLISYTGERITLNSTHPVLTLDYGAEVGGFPYLQTESPDQAVQIELKYSEPFGGLQLPYGDGPWLFVNGLANSFRTETFNITKAGKTEALLLQGGLRWQSITVLGQSSLTINDIGLRPSVIIKETDSLPGSFSTSNSSYQDVWDLGARAVQAACYDAGSQPSTWQITEDGAFIQGQYPAVSAQGDGFSNYTLEFQTKITTGGTGWRVAGGANGGYGSYFVLTSNGPTLQSSNITALPRNSLVAGYGYSIINQTILSSAPPRTYDVSGISIEENTWHTVRTTINSTGYAVSVNGKNVAFVTSAPFQGYINTGWGPDGLTGGTFGFGPFMNHAAYFKNVTVTAENGTLIYSNQMTSNDTLEEYAIASNSYAVCLDGAKRDRAIWIGDFAHTARIIASSSGRYDYIQSMIDFEFDWQYPPGPAYGLVPIQAYMGAGKEYREVYYPSEFGETDYQFFFLLTLGDYFALTNDTKTIEKYWAGTKLLVDTVVDRYLDTASGLMASADASWFTAQGTQNATAPTALFVVAMNQLVNVAKVMGDIDTATSWGQLSGNASNAINALLWNEDIGAYSLSLPQPNDTAILATAFTIRGGIASPERVATSISRLSDVFLNIGYKDNSATGNSPNTQLSPNTQGFLFESLFLAHMKYNATIESVLPAIQVLAETFWPKMVTQNEYYTGASWEYLYADGSPGIGIFTSLAHPWGGAATYIFSNYILGVRTEWDGGVGKYVWVFDPAWDVVRGLGLEWVRGDVPLFGGGYIRAEWNLSSTTAPSMDARVIGNDDVQVEVREV